MDASEKVTWIMTRKIIAGNPSNTFTQVRDLFIKFDLYHLPILEGKKLLGIISAQDVMKAYTNYTRKFSMISDDMLNKEIPVTSIMTKDPVTVSPETTIEEVAEMFREYTFHSLPVVEDGEIIGIVTTKDLIRVILD